MPERDAEVATEADVQNRLYLWAHRSGHVISVPNVYYGVGEADFISVTRSRSLIEVEIKVWRGDWLRELRVITEATPRCSQLDTGADSASHAEASRPRLASGAKLLKHHRMQLAVTGGHAFAGIPNYYYVAGLTGVIKEEDYPSLPAYVGVIEVRRHPGLGANGVHVIRPAKILHHHKLPERAEAKLSRGIAYRYWATRENAMSSLYR